MKLDRRGNQMYYHAANASGLFISALQCIYLVQRRDEADNLGKVSLLATQESIYSISACLTWTHDTVEGLE